MTSFIVYLLQQAKNVGSGKVKLELTPDDKAIEFKVNKWRLYSCRCSVICSSYQRLQCVFLKRCRSQKTVKNPLRTGWPPTTSSWDDRGTLHLKLCLIIARTPTTEEKPSEVWLPVQVSETRAIHEYPLCLRLHKIRGGKIVVTT